MFGVLLSEQGVDPLACLDQYLGRGGDLCWVVQLTNLLHCAAELATFVPERIGCVTVVGGSIGPGLAPGLALGDDQFAARIGELEDSLAILIGRSHQSILRQALEHWVDGTGGGLPLSVTAVSELGQDLVAVPRLLGEQEQDCVQDIAAFATASTLGTPRSAASTASAPGVLPILASVVTTMAASALRSTTLFSNCVRRGLG